MMDAYQSQARAFSYTLHHTTSSFSYLIISLESE